MRSWRRTGLSRRWRGFTGWFLGAVGGWVRRWWKDHPESVDSEVGAEQSAENRRLRAELREARMEIELLKKAASFFAQRVPVGARYALRPPR